MSDREKTCAFSGHRCEKLPGCGDRSSAALRRILSILRLETERTAASGYTDFITGMAQGIDLLAASIVLDLKKTYPLRLICAVPFPGYAAKFRGEDKFNYGIIAEQADEMVYVCEHYSPAAMRLRNEYMIDRASKLIAVVADFRSGTGQTIRYAERKQLDTHVIRIDRIAPLVGEDSP
ncbi:MAG: SLOG family protein [Oscillospiraceae bacterium]